MNNTNLPFKFMQELDDEQYAAAITEKTAVISAGAGSGKTRVLVARYGYLIMSGSCEVDQILAITFTNKAANEMYRRIYSLLSEYAPHDTNAKRAVENFHKAHISTLDSFCQGVARNVCRRYGISPGFESNDVKVREEALSLALRFVLDKRNDPALSRLIAEKNMRQTAGELFARPVLLHSTVSSPLDFGHFEQIQREELIKQWAKLANSASDQIALIAELYPELPEKTKLHESLSRILPQLTNAPDIEQLFTDAGKPDSQHKKITVYLKFLASLNGCNLNTGKNQAALAIKEALLELRGLYVLLEAIAGQALQWGLVKKVFPLIAGYQEILNRKKREAGILTFGDIARLAVDGLRQHKDLRDMYRNSFKMIMIDEFQDNNSLQQDLTQLLAGQAKIFYVGDEKQSIYRFRGADVSVFRNLVRNAECPLNITRNYRSQPMLVNAFNLIFGGYRHEADNNPDPAIFPPGWETTEDYKASYSWVKNKGSDADTRLNFAFFDAGRGSQGSENFLKPEDFEAFYIAEEINKLKKQKYRVFDKEKSEWRDCNSGDFAVLMRSYTHQHSLEQAFKKYGIPINADRPASLFNEAPVNDLWAYLKLLVYPDDTIAYGALLRSPFVRLSENGFTVCMLEGGAIFNETLDALLSPADRNNYRDARHKYLELLEYSRNNPVSSLITKLWYNEGYRHEALWSAAAHVYLDFFDLFYEQARIIEERGGSLVDFLDYLEALKNKEEKNDDSTLPGEESGGVKVMTIHRSKGLEFPVVFVYNCGNREKISLNRGLANYSEKWGVYLKLPQPEEIPGSGDYFYLSEKQEHIDKTEAELRRLFYVAATRAEQMLYVTAVIPAQTKKEQDSLDPDQFGGYGKQYIIKRLEQYKANPGIKSLSFLGLLPHLSDGNPLYTIAAIDCPADSTQQEKTAGSTLKEETRKAAGDYETIPAVPPYCFIPQLVNASSLHIQQDALPFLPAEEDQLLQQIGIDADEFGTIVHAFIEAMFNGEEPKIPHRYLSSPGIKNQKKLNEAALTMAEGFFNSPLGRKAAAASFRKTEYPIMTAVRAPQGTHLAQRQVVVSGKIDLLFDCGQAIYIVDFKSGKDEDISRHAGQLAVYKRAAEDIFGKPAECFLFFLRTGHEASLNGIIGKIDLEKLVFPVDMGIIAADK